MKCAEVREMIPSFADGAALTLSVRRHLSRCAECRAELAGYEAMLSDLSEMRTVAVEVPFGLERSLAAIPNGSRRSDQVVAHVLRNRKAYAGGLAVAAIGAGAAFWHGRRRLATA